MFSSRRVHRFLSFNLALQLPSRTPSSRSSWSGLPVLPSPWQSSRHSCWCGTGAWWPTCRRSGRHTRYSTRDPPVHNPSSAWPAPTLGWRTLARRTTLPWMPTAIRECISRGLAFSIDSRERSTGQVKLQAPFYFGTFTRTNIVKARFMAWYSYDIYIWWLYSITIIWCVYHKVTFYTIRIPSFLD